MILVFKERKAGRICLKKMEILSSINLIFWILFSKRCYQSFMRGYFLMIRLSYWRKQKVCLCVLCVFFDYVLNLGKENFIIKLRKCHLSAITWQPFSILILTQIHLIIILENLFQCIFLIYLVDWKEARHTANNDLINFIFMQ